jgi:transposase
MPDNSPPFVAAIAQAANPAFSRWFGLDIHKEYLTSVAINAQMAVVATSNRISWKQFREWATKTFSKTDSVVIEMTTNTWEVYDFLVHICGRVVVVHPPGIHAMMPHGAKTDRRDAHALAVLLIGGQLEDKSVWVPPQPVRDLRALIAQRYKVVRMVAVAKNRLHNVLHRHHIALPTTADAPGWSTPFHEKNREWWGNLSGLSSTERLEIDLNWDTIRFGDSQRERIEKQLGVLAAKDEAAILLQQLPGFGIVTAMTVLGAIGDIARFPNADKLVGYAGLGARVSSSGGKTHYGSITKSGRKDLRHVMVEAASHAIRCHKHWKREFERLEPKIGKNKAKVAIARKLLIVVWHLLARAEIDKQADPKQVADSLYKFANEVGKDNLGGLSVVEFVRHQLDELGIAGEVKQITKSIETGKRVLLPPSRHDPNAVIERKGPNMRGGKVDYPPFGCASIKAKPDSRTFEGRLLSGRSKPEGAKKKRPLVGPRKKVATPNPTG